MVPMKRATTIISIAAVATVLAGGATYVAAQDTGGDGSVTGDDVDRASAAALAETGNGTVSSVERDDGGYEVEVRLADGTEVDVDLDGEFAVVHTSTDDPDDESDDESDNESDDDPDDESDDESDDDSDDGSDGDNVPVGDAERQRATDAALAETGEGTVTDVEIDDGGYDVEVRLADGTEIDVDLDADFAVVQTEQDD